MAPSGSWGSPPSHTRRRSARAEDGRLGCDKRLLAAQSCIILYDMVSFRDDDNHDNHNNDEEEEEGEEEEEAEEEEDEDEVEDEDEDDDDDDDDHGDDLDNDDDDDDAGGGGGGDDDVDGEDGDGDGDESLIHIHVLETSNQLHMRQGPGDMALAEANCLTRLVQSGSYDMCYPPAISCYIYILYRQIIFKWAVSHRYVELPEVDFWDRESYN